MIPRHHDGNAQLSPAALALLRRMVAEKGHDPTAKLLGTGRTALDRLLGPGAKRETRDRVEAAILSAIHTEKP